MDCVRIEPRVARKGADYDAMFYPKYMNPFLRSTALWKNQLEKKGLVPKGSFVSARFVVMVLLVA